MFYWKAWVRHRRSCDGIDHGYDLVKRAFYGLLDLIRTYCQIMLFKYLFGFVSFLCVFSLFVYQPPPLRHFTLLQFTRFHRFLFSTFICRDPAVNALKFLDVVNMKDTSQKTQFYKVTLMESMPLIPKVSQQK